MLMAPIFLLLSLVSALIGFTGILGDEVRLPSQVLFVAFLGLFFGSAFMGREKRDPTT